MFDSSSASAAQLREGLNRLSTALKEAAERAKQETQKARARAEPQDAVPPAHGMVKGIVEYWAGDLAFRPARKIVWSKRPIEVKKESGYITLYVYDNDGAEPVLFQVETDKFVSLQVEYPPNYFDAPAE